MAHSDPLIPSCPRCHSTQVTLCGQSLQYIPEEYPGQPLQEREQLTIAYQCECGLGFTQTNSATERNGGFLADDNS